MLSDLKSKGLVRELPDDLSDLRRKRYELTDELVVITVNDMFKLIEKEIRRGLTEEEIRELTNLSKIVKKVIIENLKFDGNFNPRHEIFMLLSLASILYYVPEACKNYVDVKTVLERIYQQWGFKEEFKDELIKISIDLLKNELPKSFVDDWRKQIFIHKNLDLLNR